MEVLNRTPSAELLAEVRQVIISALEGLPMQHLVVRVVQPGRTRMVLTHVVLPKDFTVGPLAELDRVRTKVEAVLKARHLTTVVDVVFTTDPHWCALDEDGAGEQA